MTREQIAQWRKLMRRTADEGGVQVIVPNAVLSRLLDEREALLNALKDAVEALGRKPTGDPQEYLAATVSAEVPYYLAVIAKAEAE